jgi:peptidoglycan/xylan/chitin deacetylase (PgdA/CDA1 family)
MFSVPILLLFFYTFSIASSYYTIESCRDPRHVSLSFDDGVSEYTSWLLDVLREYDVKASFFILGENLQRSSQRDVVRRMLAEGHEIGIHTMTHPHLTHLKSSEVYDEVQMCSKLLQKITSKRPKYFRPPYFDYNDRVDNVIRELDYITVFAGLDTNDWQYYSYGHERIVTEFKANLGGHVVLMHDIYRQTVRAVPGIIAHARERGYKVVSLDECLGRGGRKLLAVGNSTSLVV